MVVIILSNSSFLKAENVQCKAVWGCLTVKSFAILRLTVNLLPLWLTEKLLRLTVLTVNPPSWVRNSVTGLYGRGRLILTVRTKYAFCGCLKLLILIDALFLMGFCYFKQISLTQITSLYLLLQVARDAAVEEKSWSWTLVLPLPAEQSYPWLCSRLSGEGWVMWSCLDI